VAELDPWRPRRPPLNFNREPVARRGPSRFSQEYQVPRQRVLYLGEYDLAGNDIEYNTRTVLERIVGGELAWQRIALTEEQVISRNLSRIVKEDKRFLDGGKHEAVETEALSQRVITAIVRDALDPPLARAVDQVLARETRGTASARGGVASRRSLSFYRRGGANRGAGIVGRAFNDRREDGSCPLGAAGAGQAPAGLRKSRPGAVGGGDERALLSRCIELDLPLTERSSSRIARAIKGEITLESLR
jgi:hypothetical protein